ncbi:hypothetical protein JCM11251_007617 [Rhodosporidiobolus azoricus]
MAPPPGRRATTGGASLPPARAPRSVPRASLAAARGSSALPTFNTPPPPSSARHSTRRGPATPATASAAIRHAQLITTPATTRARRSAAATTGRQRAAGWRMSLQRQDTEAEEKLLKRQRIVREVAEDALEGLLRVGYDAETGEPTGKWVLDEETQGLYEAFEGVKTQYLSKEQFLDAASLAANHPHALSSPNSPLNQTIRLCNTVTFLYLLFSSAPDPTSGVASRTASQQLRSASLALLKHVKPEGESVDDPLLRLLIELQCQVFLTAASTSRTPLNPSSFFSDSLTTLLPPSSSRYLTDRSAVLKLQSLQSSAIETVNQTGGDWKVLRTRWSWEKAVRDVRDWVEREVVRRDGGLGVEVEEEDEEEAKIEAEEETLSSRVQSVSRVGEDGGGDVFVAGGGEAVAEAGEDGLGEDSGTSDDEVAVHLGASNPPSRAASSVSTPLVADGPEEVELLRLEVTGDVEQVVFEDTQSRVEELMGLLDESYGEEVELAAGGDDEVVAAGESQEEAIEVAEEVQEAGKEEEQAEEAEEVEKAEEEEEDAELPVEAGRSAPQVDEPQPVERLLFGPGNKLYRGVGSKPQRSLLDRQPDAEKISFEDTQSQSLPNSPRGAVESAEPADGEGLENNNDFEHDFGGGFDESTGEVEEYPREAEEEDNDSAFDDIPVKAKRPEVEAEDAPATTKVDKGKGRAISREPTAPVSTQGMTLAQQWLLSASAVPSTAQTGPQASTSSFRPPVHSSEPQPQPADIDGFDDPIESDSGDESRRQRQKNLKRRRSDRNDDEAHSFVPRRNGQPSSSARTAPGPSSSSRAAVAGPPSSSRLYPRPSQSRQRQRSFAFEGSDDEGAVPPHRSHFVPSSQRRERPAPSAAAVALPLKRPKIDRRAVGERRPWDASEERFFEQCLKTHGCNWAKIRDLHGKDGKVSQNLRFRDNVALKDKARNMKNKYEANGLPIPIYLQPATSYPRAVIMEDPNGVVLTDEEDEEE